jgi:hypothetical protein
MSDESNSEKTNIEGIEKVSLQSENSSQIKVSESPETKELITKDLKKAIDDGMNLTEKSVYTKLFNELAEKHKVHYTTVSRIAKSFTKTNQQKQESLQADNSKINLKPVSQSAKPPREQKSSSDAAPSLPRPKSKQELEADQFLQNTELEFEASMIEMSFENVVMFEKSLNIPSPQMSKIKKMSKTIALYNTKMEQAGHPEKKINVGESILRYMIILGIVGMFGQPIIASLTTKSEKKDGIEKVKKSMRT